MDIRCFPGGWAIEGIGSADFSASPLLTHGSLLAYIASLRN